MDLKFSFSEFLNNAKDKVDDAIDAVGEVATEKLSAFEDGLNRIIEGVAVLLVTTCAIPVLVMLSFTWILKGIMGLKIPSITLQSGPRVSERKRKKTEETIELAKIAGFMHDIGNVVNRKHHAEYGAILANEILKKTDMSMKDRITVVSAIGHHDESTGGATDPVSAALIIADKTDVRRNRVREKAKENFDIHDRVNYAVTDAALKINTDKKVIALNLQIDTSICSMYEYFDIFLGRMMMCRGAAGILGATFKLTANGSKVL